MTLFLDIETLPAPPEIEPLLREIFELKRGRSGSFDRFLHGTSLSGNFGRILCLGYAVDDGAPRVLTGTEPAILTEFWKLAEATELFVGHNLFEFDLPFLHKRSVIHSVRPSREIPLIRHSRDPVFDTMREWDQWGNRGTSLDHLARILGIPSPKTSIDGSQVWDFFRAGREDEIYEYCMRDVAAIQAIYRRLTFTVSEG